MKGSLVKRRPRWAINLGGIRMYGWACYSWDFSQPRAGAPRAMAAPAKGMTTASSYFVYVGTYTGSTSKGIYGFRFDPKTGQLTPMGLLPKWRILPFWPRTLSIGSFMQRPRWAPNLAQATTRRTARSVAFPSIARPAPLPFLTGWMRAEAVRATWRSIKPARCSSSPTTAAAMSPRSLSSRTVASVKEQALTNIPVPA